MTTTFTRLERCLLPPPEIVRWNRGYLVEESLSTTQKVLYCVKNFFKFAGLLLVSPLTLAYETLSSKQITPILKTIDITPKIPHWPPEQRGFATSLFQTSGLGTKWSATPGLTGKCDWDKWMDNPSHIIHKEGFDYHDFFTDVLSNPEPYIAMLKAHNVTAHRFSLEWSVIEPRYGEIDEKAVALYRNFIHKLTAAGIDSSPTLSHFPVPDWFHQLGGFQKIENVDHYVYYGRKAMDLFPEVKHWWSFNELGTKALQQTREEFPTDIPEGSPLSQRVHAAGISTRNMLIAHCRLHQAAAILHPDKKLGITHQWLQFDTESGNPIEKLVAHLFTKIAFTPVYQFFKDGRFSFEIPFMANIQLEIPKEEFEKNDHFLMQLGVQAYPSPMLKMGLNHGQTYPGPPEHIKNYPLMSFGSSCEKGGTVMRFGPRWNPSAIKRIFDEAFALTKNVYITEFGSDANVHKWGAPGFVVDDAAQAEYLQQLLENMQEYSNKTFREIKGIFCWSDLRRQMEWKQGHECRLGIIEPKVDLKRRITGWTSTPASQLLAEVYGHKSTKTEHLAG